MNPAVIDLLARGESARVAALAELVRIPSISGSPDHAPHMTAAAQWLADRLQRAGLEHACLIQTGGHPAVYADWLRRPGATTVMIYGHYDVQPPEPHDLWISPAFEPEAREGKLFGRGTADDKGGIVAAIAAVEALLTAGDGPAVNVKFCLEGEEEIGSANLGPLLARERERFACDLVLNVDGDQWSADQPQIVLGLRGSIAADLTVRGPDHDLHSGVHGGAVLNPLEAISRILASMRAPDGRITVEGFYDDVALPAPGEREAIARVPGGSAELLLETGAPALHGEPGFSPREQIWIRPTLEINGLWGGHTGAGPKTVIPAAAHAKLTCRLVARQEPQRILELLARHVRRHTPDGVTAQLTPGPAHAKPWAMSADHPAVRIAAGVLTEIFGKPPYETRSGASIPVLPTFEEILGAPTVICGCCTQDSNLHAPNEFIDLATFHRGTTALAMLLLRLGQTPPGSAPPA